MRKERTEAVLVSEGRVHEYEKGTSNKSKGEGQMKSATAVAPPEVAQEQKSTLEIGGEATEDIGILDSSEVDELMQSDPLLYDIRYHSNEDEDSEDVRALAANPKGIVRKVEKSRFTSTRVRINRDTTEETRLMRRWLLSTCRSCGSMISFRSDEPHPPTCGKPQCVERFAERSKQRNQPTQSKKSGTEPRGPKK